MFHTFHVGEIKISVIKQPTIRHSIINETHSDSSVSVVCFHMKHDTHYTTTSITVNVLWTLIVVIVWNNTCTNITFNRP